MVKIPMKALRKQLLSCGSNAAVVSRLHRDFARYSEGGIRFDVNSLCAGLMAGGLVSAECGVSPNLGGNTDILFALSFCLGRFVFQFDNPRIQRIFIQERNARDENYREI